MSTAITDAGVLVTATAALAATVACVRALESARRGARRANAFPMDRRAGDRSRSYRAAIILWGLLAGLLALLAIGGPLALLDQLTDLGRSLARDQGWYRARRPLQAVLVVGMLVSSAGVLWFLVRHARTSLPRHLPAVIGLVGLGVLTIVDSLSLHAVDAILHSSCFTVPVREWLMLAAIAVVVRCATANARLV